jgi:hypothetical protein
MSEQVVFRQITTMGLASWIRVPLCRFQPAERSSSAPFMSAVNLVGVRQKARVAQLTRGCVSCTHLDPTACDFSPTEFRRRAVASYMKCRTARVFHETSRVDLRSAPAAFTRWIGYSVDCSSMSRIAIGQRKWAPVGGQPDARFCHIPWGKASP